MPSEDTKILDFNQYQTSDKAPFIIYADPECLTEKIDGCKTNPENSFTTKVGEHIPSGFSMSTISSFKKWKISMMYIEVKILWNFHQSLREHSMKIINFKTKKMKLLTKE